ncbi:DUF805 domain-containing protein [Sphingomonas morindae]|uniref:DUF805 domain-containing protein n=1 Tax=Sphingomonas morindae TaxID=1541170 RepID=A0ABY4XAB1_9SPHN|nr:DUF805 domain-containing protein [Sphingomonas morindae]USI73869.1 DUF805 domain-containing protein [Sphingomonas morindae]
MIRPLRHYADFRGRAPRIEYWLFVLFLFLLYAVAMALDELLPTGGTSATVLTTGTGLWSYETMRTAGWITKLAWLATLIPSLAVAVRRCHDIGRSGWWLLIGFIPFVGALVLLIFFLTDSQRGANRWGPDPKDAPHLYR